MLTKRRFLKTGGRTVEVSKKDLGVTLIETMIAVMVALIGVFGIGTLIFQATVTNKNQGTEVTRATVYAQDKMEKLLSLGASGGISTTTPNFVTCTQAVSSQPSACNSSGNSDSAWNTGLVAGGVDVTSTMQATCPTSGSSIGYVDFLDFNGNQLTGTSCTAISTSTPAYIRMWQVSDALTGPPALKQVTVGVWSQAAVSAMAGAKPVVVLTSYMSNPN